MWIIILVIVWAAALVSQRKRISELSKLYFRVITPHEGKGEKSMMLLDIIPMCILFVVFYIIIWPIPAAIIALIRKLSGRQGQ